MADLIFICRNKRQAEDLYERTYAYVRRFGNECICSSVSDQLYIKDMTAGDSARFVTLYEIRHKHIDDGLTGVRMTGDSLDKLLDKYEGRMRAQNG